MTVKAMTVGAVGVVPARLAVWRPSVLPAPRTVRLAAQVATLVAVGAAETLGHALTTTFVASQTLLALGALLLLRVVGVDLVGRPACWAVLHGVVLSTIAVPVLLALGTDVRSAQLVVVLALGVLWGLSRMHSAYVAAGAQLDAVLATLAEPSADLEPAESSLR